MNVNDQHRDPDLLINWIGRAVDFRKGLPEFGWGEYTVLDTNNSKVLAHCRKSEKGIAVAFNNFSGEDQMLIFEFEEPEEIVEIFGDKRYDNIDQETQKLQLTPYGYKWVHRRKKIFLESGIGNN